jgi:hypothetical protein
MVKFKDKQAGLKCIQIMNGRWYGPTLLHVESTRLFCNWATTKHCLLLPSREIQCGGRLICSTKLQAWRPAPTLLFLLLELYG